MDIQVIIRLAAKNLNMTNTPEVNIAKRFSWQLIAGLIISLLHIATNIFDPFESGWVVSILLLNLLFLYPLALQITSSHFQDKRVTCLITFAQVLQFPAALSVLVSFILPQGFAAAALSAPWMMVALTMALASCLRLRNGGITPISKLTIDLGFVFPVIGAAWIILFRFGWWPFGFKEIIVLLTPVHFHYAGLILPLIAGLTAQKNPSALSCMACLTVLLGMPLVAVGMTYSHFGGHPLLEAIAAVTFSLGGILVALQQTRMIFNPDSPTISRLLWAISSVSLMLGMSLSILYALEPVGGPSLFNIPWMIALHGSVNAFGFALCGLLAWCIYYRSKPETMKDAC